MRVYISAFPFVHINHSSGAPWKMWKISNGLVVNLSEAFSDRIDSSTMFGIKNFYTRHECNLRKGTHTSEYPVGRRGIDHDRMVVPDLRP